GMTSLFPMFLKLEGRACLVVGAGTVAEGKINGLLLSGAAVHVVAPRANAAVADWARAGTIRWEARAFSPAALDGVFLVIVATSSKDVNEAVFREAQRRNILCNVVDDPEHCDFYYTAVVRRGQLQIAISTAGESPALAQKLRRELETQYGPEYESWIEHLGKSRRELFARNIDAEERRRRLHELASEPPVTELINKGERS
ncbi:MAG TPA: bifunctional precorrin-2 dehydrogenase/sirohydrochlorin ferrochelatase, partial [Terriglobales bacterium]|nr:bifunctional precorrin-2 dehydrogenase/sirohydrochlorin ferrochelatase [Terriglobales bacterium]